MKSLLTIILFISITLLNSCIKKDYMYQFNQYIKNSSGNNCVLRLYVKTNNQATLRDTITLSKNATSKSIVYELSETNIFLPFADQQNHKILADSIVIIFEDKKQLSYNRLTPGRNIFRVENYNKQVDGLNTTYTYIITPEDYQNALPGK